MTIAGSRSGKERKVEPSSPEIPNSTPRRISAQRTAPLLDATSYDPYANAIGCWNLAIDALHDRMVAELIADHDNRMPEDWIP
jgi:hypothetical protein